MDENEKALRRLAEAVVIPPDQPAALIVEAAIAEMEHLRVTRRRLVVDTSNAEHARIEAIRAAALAERISTGDVEWLCDLADRAHELDALFEMQHTRDMEAVALWRAEDPVGRALRMPDLGDLLAWLIQRGNRP